MSCGPRTKDDEGTTHHGGCWCHEEAHRKAVEAARVEGYAAGVERAAERVESVASFGPPQTNYKDYIAEQVRALLKPSPASANRIVCHADGCSSTATHGPTPGKPVACWSHAGNFPPASLCPDCGKPFQALFHDVPCGRKPSPSPPSASRRCVECGTERKVDDVAPICPPCWEKKVPAAKVLRERQECKTLTESVLKEQARAEKAAKELKECEDEFDDLNERSAKAWRDLEKAEARAVAAEAACAEMREALLQAMPPFVCPAHFVYDASCAACAAKNAGHPALASDAGRALAERVKRLERVAEAARALLDLTWRMIPLRNDIDKAKRDYETAMNALDAAKGGEG